MIVIFSAEKKQKDFAFISHFTWLIEFISCFDNL